jgi:hypothetical protein
LAWDGPNPSSFSVSRSPHIIIELAFHSYDLDARDLDLYADSLDARELDFYDSLDARDFDGYASDLYERDFDFGGGSELEELFGRSPDPVPEPLNLNPLKKSGGG